jgi:hypothetical protein
MSKSRQDLRRFYPAVARRAQRRCEYCRAPEAFFPNRFTLDHVIPKSRSGETSIENLALCCFACQQQKLAFEVGNDPLTEESVPLFQPRRQRWGRHFRWSANGLQIEGITRTGRATIERLRMNQPRQIEARRRWRLHPDLFP